MEKFKIKPFDQVAASTPATIVTNELLDQSLHGLIFKMTGTTFDRSHIEDVRISAGQKDLVDDISGANLEKINLYNWGTTDANYMAYFFGDPSARTIRGQHLGDVDLSIYRDPLEIELGLGALVSADANCEVIAITGPPKKEYGIFSELEQASVRALWRSVIQVNAAVNRMSKDVGLGSEAGSKIRQIHFFHTALTQVELRKKQTILEDNLPFADLQYIAKQYGRVPQAGHYVLDRVVDGNQGEAELTVMGDGKTPWPFQLLITTSGLDTITAYADLYAPIPLL